MFESESLSREELEQRYEQACVIISLVKQTQPDAIFKMLMFTAANLWASLKMQKEAGSTEGNLPPGWTVYSGKR